MKLALLAAALLAAPVLAADEAPAVPAPTKAAPTKAAPTKAAPTKAAATTATAVVPVKGMSCGGCVAHVNEELRKLPGVRSVDTNLDEARTTVVYEPAKLKPEQIVKAIAATGYEPGAPIVK